MNTFGKSGWLTKDRIEGSILVLVSIFGFLHTIFGEWSLSTGEQAKLFPRIIYVLILVTGLMLVFQKNTEGQNKDALPDTGIKHTLTFVGMGAIYSFMVLNIGLAVATFLYIGVMIAFLTVNPVKQWKKVVIPSFIVAIVIWAVFTYFMPIVIPHQLLI
jgi:hypothetical protein